MSLGLHMAAQRLHMAAMGLHMSAQRLRLAAEGLHFAAQGLSVAPMRQIYTICCIWAPRIPGNCQVEGSWVLLGPYLTAWGWRFKAEIYHNAGSRLKDAHEL